MNVQTGVGEVSRPRFARTRVPQPFRGLAGYTASDEDALLFFGRDTEVARAESNLLASRLTILYGPSGVGKSSLLRAGVVHNLLTSRERFPSELGAPGTIVVLLSDWHGDPVEALCGELEPLCEELGAADVLDPEKPLRDTLESISSDLNVEILIVLDQFEEYLASHPPGEGDRLTQELPAVVADRSLRAHFLISLREDALAGLDRFKGRIRGLFDNYLRLDRLDVSCAREAIVGPIERYGELTGRPVALDPGLVDELLRQLARGDVALAKGAPPASAPDGRQPTEAGVEPAHLQLVMARLWEASGPDPDALHLATLDRLGGAATIVREHVTRAMDALSEHDQRLAAQVLQFLVAPSGAKSRQVPSDLAAYTRRDESEVERLLGRLAAPDARILRRTDPPPGSNATEAYELFHDVLASGLMEWRERHERRRLEMRSRRLLTALVATAALAAGLAVYAVNPDWLRRLELRTIDARFSVRGSSGPDRQVAIVDVGRVRPRSEEARVLSSVAAAHPRAIAEDIVYSGSPAPAGSGALVAAIRRSPVPVVLATSSFLVDDRNRVRSEPLIGSADIQTASGARVGYAGLPTDPGGIVRRVDYDVTPVAKARFPTLPAATADAAFPGRVHCGGRVCLPTVGRRTWFNESPLTTWIDYRGGPGTFKTIRAADVLAGRVPPREFEGKVVVIGYAEPAIDQWKRTSVDGRPAMSGPELEANAISTLLRRAPLRDSGRTADVLLVCLLGALPFVASLPRRRSYRIAVLAGGIVAFLAIVQIAFNNGRIVAMVAPLIALMLSLIGVAALWLVNLARERRRAQRHDGEGGLAEGDLAEQLQ